MTRLGGRRPSVGTMVFVAWLVGLWMFLWGGPSLANALSGALVAVVLLVAVPRPGVAGDDPIVRPVAAASLIVWFAWKLVEANLKVAAEVLRPASRSRIRTGIVAVALPGCPTGVLTAVANAITLTPGTLTVEVDPRTPTLFIHVLQLDDPEVVRADVYEVERRTVAAVGSAAARAAVAGREPQR